MQDRNERERQLERDHALALARQEHEFEIQRVNSEREIALSDRWLNQRDEAYTTAIREGNEVLSAAGKCMASLISKDARRLMKDNSDFVNAGNVFMRDGGRVEIYGSDLTEGAMAAFVQSFLQFGAYITNLQEKLDHAVDLEAREPADALRIQSIITEKFEDFRKSAKRDLGIQES